MRAKRIAFVNAAWVNPTWLTLIRNNHSRVHGLIKNEEGLYRSLLSLLRDLSCGHPVKSPAQSNRIDGSTPVDRIKSICRDVLPSLCVCYLIHLRPDGTRTGRVNPTRIVQNLNCHVRMAALRTRKFYYIVFLLFIVTRLVLAKTGQLDPTQIV